jgi:RNA polymerase sigma-70 factor (family 1)
LTGYQLYTEQQLIQLLRSGDAERYHTTLFTYGLRFLKITTLAEDLVQDVFLKLWEARDKLEVHTSLSAYIHRMTHNQAMDRIKSMKRDTDMRTEVALTMDIAQYEDAARSIASYESLLENTLKNLPPQRRRVFVLCRQEGRTYEQAAAELGISRHTVKEYMTDALRLLRAAIIDHPDTPL